ncbi:ubiquinol-cytochrome c reductase iron-sulfur subunit [Nakamurella deserti]|uniref:QcrA and Rieske domain-containing protein n=1 Tax=Nakamurella deserti TaxID=2164074 RepID=UPI000DBE8CD2|nr:Rieske (2Fe-2S) protein [Nakamurella deserti]
MTQTEPRPATGAETTDHGCACAAPCGSRGRSVTRRTAIGAGVVAGAAFVTACGSSDPGTATLTSSSSTSSTTSSATAPGSSSPSSTAAGTTAGTTAEASSTGSAAPAPSGTEIAKLADVPSGGSLIVENGGDKIALARNADGSVVAHSAICTHQGCAVNADGAVLACPCHGSTFDAFSGAATKGPATAALETLSVEVSGDAVYLTA